MCFPRPRAIQPIHLTDARKTAAAANEIVADDDYEQQHATLSVCCRTATEPVHVCATKIFRFSWLAEPLLHVVGEQPAARRNLLGESTPNVTFFLNSK